jgi:hypothetical protein
MGSNTAGFICVPIAVELYNELVLRVGDPRSDVTSFVEHALESYLERTEDDGKWSDAYFEWKERSRPAEEFRTHYGNPDQGFNWTPVFLPNGTKLSMLYDGKTHTAEIRHNRIYLGDEAISSPSNLASRIANGTSRNAWRDLRVKRPSDREFRPADDLRREGASK